LEIKAAIARGENPAATRAAEQHKLTFRALVDSYIDRYAQHHRKLWKRDKRRLDNHFARWRPRRLSDLPRDEVRRTQTLIVQKHEKVASNRAMTLLRALFNWAIRERLYGGANLAVCLTFFSETQVSPLDATGCPDRVGETQPIPFAVLLDLAHSLLIEYRRLLHQKILR
jgi:hypothetical protein